MSPATVRRAIKDLRKALLIETQQRFCGQGDKSILLNALSNNITRIRKNFTIV
jgi:DNA-binding transcriptional ArsR family regulator